jgi:hypothetical protein
VGEQVREQVELAGGERQLAAVQLGAPGRERRSTDPMRSTSSRALNGFVT